MKISKNTSWTNSYQCLLEVSFYKHCELKLKFQNFGSNKVIWNIWKQSLSPLVAGGKWLWHLLCRMWQIWTTVHTGTKNSIQESFVIRGRYIPRFWPRILNSQIKDTFWLKIWPFILVLHLRISKSADEKTADNEVRLYSISISPPLEG